MREVDDALAKVFPSRAESERSAGVPPAPHRLPRRDHAQDRHYPDFPTNPDNPSAFPRGRLPVAWPALVRLLEDSHADRFERLADTMESFTRRSGKNVIWFASCQRAEGCTTLVMSLARSLGRRPGRTLLIDCDLNTPTIARQLALNPRVGLESVVLDGLRVSDALIASPADGLTFLPLKGVPRNPRAFLQEQGWSRTVDRLRREFDLILIDGGPLIQGYGGARVPVAADAAVLVRNKALSGPRALDRARMLLEKAGIPLIGMAETFAP